MNHPFASDRHTDCTAAIFTISVSAELMFSCSEHPYTRELLCSREQLSAHLVAG